MSGFIAMSRDALDHPVLRDAERFRAWFWLIANASWKPNRARIKGESIDLSRGELSFSQRFLAEKWGWSKSRVDRFIADLRAEGMIETRSKIGATADHAAGQGQSIISICNYDKYQTPDPDQRGNVEPVNGATAGQQRGKEEQGNKGTSKRNTQTRMHVLPDDWIPRPFGLGTKSHAVMQDWPPGEFETTLEHFTAHHRAKGTKFVDWQEAWSTWVLNSKKWSSTNGNSRNNAGPYPARNGGRPKDGAIAALDRKMGLDGYSGEPRGHDDSAGSGDRGLALAGPRSLFGPALR